MIATATDATMTIAVAAEKTSYEGDQGDHRHVVGHRKRQHEKVAGFARSELHQSGNRHRQHENIDRDQIERQQPPGELQFARCPVLHHCDVKLARQHDDREGRKHDEKHPALQRRLVTERGHHAGVLAGRVEQLPRPVEHHEHDRQSDQREGQQLDNGFHRNGEDETVLVFGRIGVTGAENRRERGQHQRHEEGDIGEKEGLRHPAQLFRIDHHRDR
jgi:hypothetical protein